MYTEIKIKFEALKFQTELETIHPVNLLEMRNVLITKHLKYLGMRTIAMVGSILLGVVAILCAYLIMHYGDKNTYEYRGYYNIMTTAFFYLPFTISLMWYCKKRYYETLPSVNAMLGEINEAFQKQGVVMIGFL